MYIIEDIILNLIFILFPLTLYLIYKIYINNMDLEEKTLLLEAALFSSLYLSIKFGITINLIFPMILFNIPLMISYYKKRRIAQGIISITLILYYNMKLNINIWFLIIEYILYFIMCNYASIKNKSISFCINSFIFIKAFFISFEMFLFINPNNTIIGNITEIVVVMIVYTFFSYMILYFLFASEKSVDLNHTLYELEKEKTLRNSLFKLTHEIKNPIAVCKGYLDMVDYHDEEKLKKYLPILRNEIGRTITIMDDFVDCTKIHVDKEEIDIIMLLEETLDSINPIFKNKHAKVNVNLPDDEIYINADYNRLKQVFINIFKNSIEAKDKDRCLTIDIDAKVKHNKAYINISDNGVGIEDENLDKMGEMFFTTKEKGTGLGVSLSKEIITLHGGNIKYQSKKDKGTTVTITLPVVA